uniref:NME/NM23 family member 5 n=1 Tax=Jaculus jaculus TaxID=51337 RepID=A0A8C5KMS1_JACJA
MDISMPLPQIYVEQTLAIIKPDIVDKEEEIHDIILRSGFTIVQRRKLHLSPEHCSNFYVEQYGKMFFPNLTAYMSSGPLIAMILARHNAISYWKELLGPTNSLLAKETHPDSLRAIYGTDDLRNALHGSNDFAAAEREIRFMFPKGKLQMTAWCLTILELIWLADWLLRNNPNKPKLHLYSVAPEPLVPPDQE